MKPIIHRVGVLIALSGLGFLLPLSWPAKRLTLAGLVGTPRIRHPLCRKQPAP